MENEMNIVSGKRFLTVLLAVMAILLPLSATAQTDGSRRKRPKPPTEQTQPTKKPNRKPAEKKTTLSSPDGYANGHAYVDLGLPSGIKWATCNVGASSPGEYGGYYAWGETTTKSSYDESNSLTYGKSVSKLRSAGIIDESGNLTMNYDAARANWGGSWRMPTKAELEELKNKCTWDQTSQDGSNGYKVTGPNGNSIFLPAAGYRYGTSCHYAEEHGSYWSSTLYEGSYSACYLYFITDIQYVFWLYRYYGWSVRPVSE